MLITGCSSSGGLQDKLFQLQPGATKDQVMNLLGVPNDRSFQDANEAWQYCESAFGVGGRYSTVWFSSNVVRAITTDTRNYGGLTCDSGLGPVDWGQIPPDNTVEIRNR